MREKRKARLNLYHTAMALRGAWLHLDSLRALNAIDVVFNRKKDKPVRDAWAKVIAHAYTKEPDPVAQPAESTEWSARMLDLRVDLYQLLGNAVGYDLSVDYIKTHMYYPKYHVEAEVEGIQIRKQLAKAITNDGLRVFLVERNEPHGG